MANTVDAIREATQAFLSIKEKVVDKLDDGKGEEVGSKLRTRAREVPEMILELGLVPTLSYCLAKSNVDSIKRIVSIIERDSSVDELKNIKTEELAYALYTYALLKYIVTIVGGLRIEAFADMNKKEISSRLLKYLEELADASAKAQLHELLQPYLLQFKRLCEAVYKPER